MKIIHFSGLRLGAPFPDWPEHGDKIRARQKQILRQLFEQAAALEVTALVCAGDLFDSNSVPPDTLDSVRDVCREHPEVSLAVLPGGRDPWAAYSVHRHLSLNAPENLLVLTPGLHRPCDLRPDLWLYGLPVDATGHKAGSLGALKRGDGTGLHIAVAYGDFARLRPGPEQGLVMVAPEVAAHPFDCLALADGGAAERGGDSRRPMCYADPLVPADTGATTTSTAWLIAQDEQGSTTVEQIIAEGIRFADKTLDVSHLANVGAVAQAIRREVDESVLARVTLTGTRPADVPILEPRLLKCCEEHLLGLQITDHTQVSAPLDTASGNRLLAALWAEYRQAPEEARREWNDAIKLCAAGVIDPNAWREAPWVHS
jgi:hypothetical protein